MVVNRDGDEKSYLTSNIFEKPRTLLTKGIGQYFSKQSAASSEKYLFRHTFSFEEDECQHPINLDDPQLTVFLNADKYVELMRIKDDIIDELTYKFMTNDKKVIITMKEVLNEHFEKTDKKLDNISDKFDKYIKDQNKGQEVLMENQTDIMENQNKLMVAIKQIQIKIDDPLSYDHNAALQKELQATKQLLEEEKKARRISKTDHHDIEMDTLVVVQPQPQDDDDMINHEENQFGIFFFFHFFSKVIF